MQKYWQYRRIFLSYKKSVLFEMVKGKHIKKTHETVKKIKIKELGFKCGSEEKMRKRRLGCGIYVV